MANGSLMKVKFIAECSPWTILQYFWPALSNNWSWNPIFGILFDWLLKTGFTVPVIVHAFVAIYWLFSILTFSKKKMQEYYNQHNQIFD